MADKKLIGKISRQWTATCEEREDFEGYDDIIAMKVKGIPNLEDEDYYVQFVDTTGRDIVQQAVNIYSTQSPKWNVLPRGLGDIDTAEEFERTIEWYMWKAAQMGRKRFHSEALINACKYNRVCAQLEWVDAYSFCVKIYHPSTILFEYGSTLQWVSVVNNVSAVSILEHWQEFAGEATTSGAREKKNGGIYEKDKIGFALKKIEKLIEDDEEQRMMYIDYTDKDTRYTYCYPVSDEKVDDTFGFDDDGGESADFIIIQDKDNKLGFINWAIAEGEGDPLLAPMLKANLYENINDSETLKRTIAFRRAFFPMFIQQGREDADAETDFSGSQVVLKSPTGASLQQTNPPPLDPAFNELSAQDRNIMTNSIGIGQTASLQMSNVQHATLQDQIKLRLAQLEPYKRITEQAFVQIAYLIFKWAKKQEKVLKSQRLYAKSEKLGRGSEVTIEPSQINLDALYIECKILPNNENDKLQITNQISMLKQAGIAVPDDEFVEMLYMGSPQILRTQWEKQELRNAVLQEKVKEIVMEADIKMAQAQAGIQLQSQQASMQMEQEAMAQQQQAMAQQQPQGPMPQSEAPQQGMPMPSDQAMQGQGFDAATGGQSPQGAAPELTQAMRP